ncbi:MAG TPA: leucyl/phenylalanyl-tRNA--protein transferase [Burkholderiales bacterium]|nr:leucyl/phenylalanyl-tRNA--protein transferase [Burkholderiales bacterium]
MIPWLGADDPFPPLSRAARQPNGLLAAGADLSPARLIEAYRNGIFPWFGEGEPILWWSPDPRMVLFPDELKVSRSLARTLRRGEFELRADTSFRQVIEACAAPRPGQDGTWITADMMAAYSELHARGIAHCIEAWRGGELAGGLYGIALGRAFYGESMFSCATDASKVAFVALVRQLQAWNFGLVDCQMSTRHLASLGAREIPRAQFARLLAELVHYPADSAPGIALPWRLEPGIWNRRPRDDTA